MIYFQQGDVILKPESIKDDLINLKTNLLHRGEQHHHTLSGEFKLLIKDDIKYLESNGCQLNHEEHKSFEIPKGFYRLEFVQEYDHFLEESKDVID